MGCRVPVLLELFDLELAGELLTEVRRLEEVDVVDEGGDIGEMWCSGL